MAILDEELLRDARLLLAEETGRPADEITDEEVGAYLSALDEEDAACLHTLFERQAATTPEAPALVAPGGTVWTYRELDRRAGLLALELRAAGAGPEAPATIGAEASVEATVRVLASWKAGSPDPADLAALVDAGGRLAALEHRALQARLAWLQEAFPLDAADVVLHRHAPGSAAGLLELWWPLLAGASVAVSPLPRNRKCRPTVAVFTPGELAAALAADVPWTDSLRLVLVYGGPLLRSTAEEFADRGWCDLVTLWAPPEVAGEVAFRAGVMPLGGRTTLPLGRPADLVAIHLLDARLEPVPPGLPGEIHAACAGLARGYLDDPAATAERFVPDPFSGIPGERMFRTGDVGRLSADGEIELLGAARRQAWVDGRRVDLERLEAALLAVPGVADCAVLVRETPDGRTALVACVSGSEALSPECRARLAGVSPVPLDLVAVASMPLGPEGRPDREALERLEVIDPSSIERWERAVQALPEVAEAAVAVREAAEPAEPLALADLLGEEAAAPAAPRDRGEIGPRETRPAVSRGGALRRAPEDPATLPDALRRAALREPGHGVVHIRADGSELFRSYPELLEEAERVLGGLRARGLGAGARVLFQLDLGQDFLAAFWGCQLGGLVPVPVSIPAAYEAGNAGVEKLCNAWRLLGRPQVVCGDALAPAVRGLAALPGMESLEAVEIGALRGAAGDSSWHAAAPDELALLFLTSGSTGLPKAVMQSHRALLAMVAGTTQAIGFTRQDAALNWMPLDHVGAVCSLHLLPVWLAARQVHVGTQTVLQDPLRWLDWIERHRARISWAPNFAFALINERAEEIARRRWDLSSMRFLINAGEAVGSRVARRFLRLLAPHGLADGALRPAFGMSETCSGITWSTGFTLAGSNDDDLFVDLGPPIPGAELRIADAADRVLSAGEVGRLQVRGPSVTTGYFESPAANREAFTADGWFTTGDLAFLRDGRLVITGREKDVIIVRGANYYCHEIEAVVEEIPGVEVSWTAACGVRRRGAEAEQLAIVFSPSSPDEEALPALLREIRQRVGSRVGLRPELLLPVRPEEVPKTAIGKIQRAELARRIASGELDARLQRAERLAGGGETVPSWFFRPVWRRREPVAVAEPGGATLLLADGAAVPLAERLREALGSGACIVEPVAADPEPLRRRLARLRAEGTGIGRIVDLRGWGAAAADIGDWEALERSLEGLQAFLALVQAAGQEPGLRILTVASYAQKVEEGDPVDPGRAAVLGLLETAAQEMPGTAFRHLDLPPVPAGEAVRHILRELRAGGGERQVAVRGGRRLVSRLERVDPAREPDRRSPWVRGGVYLLSGGLGGVGFEVAKALAERLGARLLLVGRTPLGEREAALREIETLGGEALYGAADATDPAALAAAVETARQRWGRGLDGVIHLAGQRRERLLAEETPEGLAEALRPKVAGAWALHRLVRDRPSALFVSFSSVNGTFGGATVGAYAAASRFLDAFVHAQRAAGLAQSWSLAWSFWDELGMSRGSEMKGLAVARGFAAIPPRQGIASLLAAVQGREPHLLIGLDATRRPVRLHLAGEPCRLERLAAYAVLRAGAVPRLPDIVVRDRFGRAVSCELVAVEGLPRTTEGEVDRGRLAALAPGRRGASGHAEPRTETERLLAGIWRAVLGRPQVGIHDNFFELGGDSILGIQVVARANQAGLLLAPRDIVRCQTVAELAAAAGAASSPAAEQGEVTGPAPLSAGQRWLFEQRLVNVHHHNQAVLFELREPVPPAVLREALRRLIAHHDALRLRFCRDGDGWRQEFAPPAGETPFEEVDAAGLDATALEAALTAAQAGLDITRGPLLRAVLLTRRPRRPDLLLFAIHHLAVDGFSWRLLLADFQTLCAGLARGEEVRLPAKTLSFQEYCQRLERLARSGVLHTDLDFWLHQGRAAPGPLPLDLPDEEDTVATSRTAEVALDPEETRALLQDLPRQLGVQINDVLLTGLALAFRGWTDERAVQINLVAHGRQALGDDSDLSRTVGWCSVNFPVALDTGEGSDPGEALRSVQERLRSLPRGGASWAWLRYLSGDAAAAATLAALPRSQVLFSYFGQFDALLDELSLFRPSREPAGLASDLRSPRLWLLAVSAQVLEGRLELSVGHGGRHLPSTARRLADGWAAALRSLIAHGRAAVSPDNPELLDSGVRATTP